MVNKKEVQKLARIAYIKRCIDESERQLSGINTEQLVADMGCSWGVARRTALEYIHNVIESGFAYEKKGIIYKKGKDSN